MRYIKTIINLLVLFTLLLASAIILIPIFAIAYGVIKNSLKVVL